MTLVNEKLSQKPLNNDPRNGIFHFIKKVSGLWKSFGLAYEDLVSRLNQDLTIDANVTPAGSDGDVQLNVNGELGVDADLHFDNIEKVLGAGRTVQHDAALKEIKIGFPSQDYAAEALLNGREANANLNGFARFGVPLVKKQYNITSALALSGTATGGSTTTIVDSGASFTSEVEGKVVEITYTDASRVGTYVLTATSTELTLGHTILAVTAGCTYKILSTIELNNEQLDSYVFADTTNDSAGLILPTLHSDVFNATVNAIVAATAGDNRFYIVLKGNAKVRGSSFAFLNKMYQAAEFVSKSETRWDVVSTEAINENNSVLNLTLETSSFAGVTTSPSFVNNGDGSITLGNFKVRIFDNSVYEGRAKEVDVLGDTFTLPDNDVTYIVVNYNAGTPILVALTNGQYDTINQSDILPLITISRTGNILHYFPDGFGTYGNGLPNRLLDDIAKTRRLTKEAGGINIVQRADRVVEITAGVGRLLIQPYTVDAFVSGQANNFLWDVYYNGTTWLYNSAATVWDNLQRNPTTGLVELNNNQWGFIYIFRGIEEAKHAYFIRSQNEYGTASAAKAAAFEFDARSYAPLWLTRHALPIAVIVFQKSATSGTAYQYNIVQGVIFGAAGLELSPAGATGDVQLNDGAGGLGVSETAGDGRYVNGVFRFDSIKSQFKTLTPTASINQDVRQGVNSSVSYGSNFNVSLTNIESGMSGIILLNALDYLDFTLQGGNAVWEKEPVSPLANGSHSVHWFTDGVDVYASIKNYAYRAKVSLYSNYGTITIDVYLNDIFVEAITSGTDVTTTKIYNIKKGDLLSIRLVEGGGTYYSHFYPYVNGEAKPSDQLDYTSYGNNVDILCNYIPPL